jgi:3-hydroxyacyl-CoA dehydrogenase/enoyl-CoA hydratase/3-hydroxybutyryl-CoA epimerase
MPEIIRCDQPLSPEFAGQLEAALKDPEIESIQIEFHPEPDDPDQELERLISDDQPIQRLRRLLRQMEETGKPVVAWIESTVADLRLEIALSCHERIASDGSFEIRYSWLRYGVMPMLGGTQRLPRLTNLQIAARVLLFGESVPFFELASESKNSGFKIRDQPAFGEAFSEYSDSKGLARQPWDRNERSSLESQSLAVRQELEQIYLKLRRRNSPEDAASTAILRCFQGGLERTFDAGLRLEAEQWNVVRHSKSTLNCLKTLYFANRKARRAGDEGDPIRTLGVLGAGLMGTGIAFTAARAGLRVVLVEINEKARELAQSKIMKIAESDPIIRRRASISQLAALIRPSADIADFADCDFIVEAIFEQVDLKKSMLKQIADLTPAILASNTTTLPITDLATACRAPDRFIGTHFFAPVDRMALEEIIPGRETSDQTLQQARRLAIQLGKSPVVVHDGPGFFTSRVVMAYVQEALFLLSEGVAPSLIDNVAQNAGMPIGPLAMADLTALNLLENIFETLAAHHRGSARWAARTLGILREFTSRSRFGRKNLGGVFNYAPERNDWPELSAIFPPSSKSPSPEEIEHRLFAIQTIEALHSIKEGIIEDPSMADLASVLGWSYPAFRGGVISYRETPNFDGICADLTGKFGERFEIPLL